ncbi:winged helix-turn-helix transcriptional regulator [Pedobacter sp. PAMC26386]|nr:winged helix-turn-helix transcriptional regulator [Pedobacter sp. PAMC26386]
MCQNLIHQPSAICAFENLIVHYIFKERTSTVKRIIYAEVPPRVEYELTLIGYKLEPIIRQLETCWNKQTLTEINKPRRD